MLRLPVELVELIFSFVDKEGLRSLFYVSRFCRALAPPHLLSRYHFSMAKVRSGVINLPPGAYFLVPVIYRIHPIQELIIPAEKRRLDLLVSVLRELPPIPNVVLRGHIFSAKSIPIATLIATLSRNGRDPVVVVGRGLALSLPRHGAPLKKRLWLIPLPRLSTSSLASTAEDIAWGILLALPFLLVLLISSICNIYVVIDWICRRAFTAPMDLVKRIVQDLEPTVGSSMRLQTLLPASSTRFTLVTFTGTSSLTIARMPGLGRAMLAAILTALDLGTQTLQVLTIHTNTGLDLSALTSFIHRHSKLTDVKLKDGALHRASLSDGAVIPPGYEGHITRLVAPAAYIAPILRFERRIADLTITNANARPRDLERALAAGPTPLPSFLQLDLAPPARTLPWRAAVRDIEAAAAVSAHPSVRRLTLNFAPTMQLSARDVEALPRWLGRCFPALVYLQVRVGEGVSAGQQVALREALAAGYTGFAGLTEAYVALRSSSSSTNG
ncbi:hypothetical protein C8R46DRAFT_1186218 [Mycena filopes]|nr:hypothetical protein C8R46DRAFT_1186218 [Mycena filopes]